METKFDVPQGQFYIQRLPLRKNEVLRAWDAADEYLLQSLDENKQLSIGKNILVLNDRFGAITIALNQYSPIALSDSFLSQQATRLNLAENQRPLDCVELRNSLDWPENFFDVVLIKVPKTLALLEDQLIRLQGVLTNDAVVIAAGMVKAMPVSVWKLMERYLGDTKPSLARKKARLIFTSLALENKPSNNPYPVYYQLENTNYRIANHANVFSRDSLDIGTRFLLQHLPKQKNHENIVDLGCGNGVVGLMLAEYHVSAQLYFIDESYMAVASAKENFQQAFKQRKAHFSVSDGLTDFESDSMDLVVCNPPFHQQNTLGNQIALTMFYQSKRVLRQGGELWVIGNRHLNYYIDLKRCFGGCEKIAENKKFVIWRMVK